MAALMRANEAVNRIIKGYFADARAASAMRAAVRSLSREDYRRAALFAARGISRYLWTNATLPQKVARIGAAWAALDVATRLAGPGGMLYDDYGRFNIAGVPFI